MGPSDDGAQTCDIDDAEYASANDQDDAAFTEGRAPDVVAYQQGDVADEFDWAVMEFDFDEPTETHPPNRNAFNLCFPDGEQVDIAAWDEVETKG